jgi:uncharacterized membrane protein
MSNFWCWFYKKYILLFCLLILLYTAGAFLAPILLNSGSTTAAGFIYGFYGATCHQFAFRSWFLYGEQVFYPLRISGIKNVVTYEDISKNSAVDLSVARIYSGNATVGYKLAICQRDIAINLGFILAGLGFAFVNRKWQPIPILFWMVLGLFPVFFDGVTQLGGSALPVLNTFPPRESTPLLRTTTGLMFGLTTGLFIFPKLEDALRTVKENHRCKEI